jgi:putative ABC transport system permease protein
VLSYREAQPQLRRFLEQLTTYLGLIGLTALFVGGIGVAGTVRAFIREKLSTIAILKTVGADSWTVTQSYLFQALFLGLLGSMAGAALGILLERAFPVLLAGLLPLEQVDLTLTPGFLPILKGIAMGVLTTLLFSLWPLLGIRRIRPALIFRRDVAEEENGPRSPGGHGWHPSHWAAHVDVLRALTGLGIGIGLASLAIWQAGSLKIGVTFIGALLLSVTLLRFAAVALVRLSRLIPSPRAPRAIPIRHALRNLHRPGSQAAVILLSVGIGVMVMVAASLLERSLVDQIGESRPVNAPTFFFIDIQPDQKQGFEQLLNEQVPYAEPAVTPLVRSRLFAINGRRVQQDQLEETGKPERERENSWYFTREYVLTFLSQLPKDNVIVRGRWWDAGDSPQISIEEEAARNLGLDLGSAVEFDIQGTTLTAEVRSIRKVDWSNFSTNFYMILSPGSLEGAPFTYVATARVSPGDELRLQQAVVAQFPNVTAINIGDVMENFARILEQLSVAIRAIAAFCLLAGAVVMAAALATTRYQRLYESVILKAFGATRGLIAQAFAAEYAVLGTIAGTLGVVLASVLSWVVLTYVLEMNWRLQPTVLVVGLLLTIVVTVSVGFLSTFRILKERPLAVLRGE